MIKKPSPIPAQPARGRIQAILQAWQPNHRLGVGNIANHLNRNRAQVDDEGNRIHQVHRIAQRFLELHGMDNREIEGINCTHVGVFISN